jgi:hypothetical protein
LLVDFHAALRELIGSVVIGVANTLLLARALQFGAPTTPRDPVPDADGAWCAEVDFFFLCSDV